MRKQLDKLLAAKWLSILTFSALTILTLVVLLTWRISYVSNKVKIEESVRLSARGGTQRALERYAQHVYMELYRNKSNYSEKEQDSLANVIHKGIATMRRMSIHDYHSYLDSIKSSFDKIQTYHINFRQNRKVSFPRKKEFWVNIQKINGFFAKILPKEMIANTVVSECNSLLMYEEYLTSSLALFAVTNDSFFYNQYRTNSLRISDAERKLIALLGFNKNMLCIETINSEMYNYEINIQQLVRDDRPNDALAILESKRYLAMKDSFEASVIGLMDEYLKETEVEADTRGLNFALIGGSSVLLILLLGYIFFKVHRMEERIRRQNERLLQKNHDLEIFASHLSHDLKSPISTIGRLTQMVVRREKDNLTSDTTADLGIVVSESQRLYELINNVLLYTRASSKSGLSSKLLLNELFQESANAFVSVSEVDISWSVKNIFLVAPKTAMQQIMQNLLQNAIIHNDKPKVVIRLSAKTTLDGWVEIRVQDNGPGIPQEKREQIFQPFLGSGRSGSHGLGLAIVKKLIDDIGGTITILDQPQTEGTCFLLRIPKG